jgi:transcription-repair coupling factor (superfamily II helicase)
VPRRGGDVSRFITELREHLDRGGRAGLVLASRGRLDRTRELVEAAGMGDRIAWCQPEDEEETAVGDVEVAPGQLVLGLGHLGAGARVGPLLLECEGDVFGDVPAPRPRAARAPRGFRSDLRDLKRGDCVVHADHGIGKYHGVVTIGEGDTARDFMLLHYEKEDKLYVPLDRLDLIEKYSGVGGFSPRLDKLGGVTWEKVKRSVKKAMVDMTRELLDLYAARRTVRGFRFSQDGEWQREFEAAFPHEETIDQQTAIDAVKSDMCSEGPMDRLVVGDVGYGKTEVGLRAAFKTVMDGKQVAILAPTTVLALQHQATFSRRCSAWPVKVELLSRFRSPKQIAATLERLKSGDCDIVIGTHRLLSKDVLFKDLGLLVVDEEQRFGVRHKERIKQLRKEVDVLTLTATPIPRTLSMAMGGLRDMSVIETPPLNRHAIQTYVLPFSADVVAAACRQEGGDRSTSFTIACRASTPWRTSSESSRPGRASRWPTGRCRRRSWKRRWSTSCAARSTSWSRRRSSRTASTFRERTPCSSTGRTDSGCRSSTSCAGASAAPSGRPTRTSSSRTAAA